jgi:hypothetical protein
LTSTMKKIVNRVNFKGKTTHEKIISYIKRIGIGSV